MGRLLPTLLAVLALVGLGAFVGYSRDEWATLSLVCPWCVVGCAAAMVASLAAAGPVFWLTVDKLGTRVGLLESVWLAVVTTAVNTVVPFQGGAAVRAAYLKRRHGLDVTAFAATFLGYNVLRLGVVSAAGLATAGWLAVSHPTPELSVLVAAAGVSLAGAVAACLVPPTTERGGIARQRLAALSRGWHALRRPPRFLAGITGLVAVQFVAELCVLWAAYAALGVTLDVAPLVLIGAFGVLAVLTGVTPNGLGVYEAMVAGVGTTVNVDPVHGLAAAVLSRLVMLGVLAALTPVAVASLALSRVDLRSNHNVV